VVLSGFRIELYSQVEKCCAYWYCIEVVDTLLLVLDTLLKVVPEEEGSVIEELKFQKQFSKGLKEMASAMLLVNFFSAPRRIILT
jgi:hypothetical protein